MLPEKKFFQEGYQEARDFVFKMAYEQLLILIDGLYGRGKLPKDYSHLDLLTVALDQTTQHFLTDYGKEQIKSWKQYGTDLINVQN